MELKSLVLNGKVYDLLSIIDLDKINSRKKIKGQSIWINTTFKDQKETNNNSHLCFPFVTRSLNNLLSFSIYLQHDKNKEIEFYSSEKKISVLNFQIDVFLKWVEHPEQNRTSQQIKEEQINFLPEDVEKNLDEYKKAVKLKDKKLSDAKENTNNG